VIRTVALWNPAAAREVFLWPLRDLLLAYVAILRREALARFEHDVLIWAILAPHQKNPSTPPKPPRLLR